MTALRFYAQLLSLLLFACSPAAKEDESATDQLSPEQQKVKNLEEEVLHMHDDVMPLVADLVALKGRLEKRNQELESAGASGAQDQVIIHQMIISNLEAAHESMMDWMRKYEVVDVNADVESNLVYLEQEKSKINEVTKQIYSAIAAAEEALEASSESE